MDNVDSAVGRTHTEGYAALESRLGYAFRDARLLERALTHSTYAYDVKLRLAANGRGTADGGARYNETLEFLGDSVLGFVIADRLYTLAPDGGEGELSRRRAAIVCEKALAGCARGLGLGRLMRFGKAMGDQSGGVRDSVLSDAMEAVFAAVYLDGGIEAARRVILGCLSEPLETAVTASQLLDHKTRLQELAQAADKNARIVYTVTAESGPVHRRHFTSDVAVNGRTMGAGEGSSKKESEQNAAKAALEKMKCI